MPVLDVVIPAHERPELTAEAIRSVLNQTLTDLRLFVVDDASETPLENQIGIDDPRLSFIRSEKNRGPGVSRNRGAAAGTSPYIAFLDSDDLWHAEKAALQIAYMKQNPQCRWMHTGELWLRNGREAKQKREHRKQGGVFFERAFERCLISPSAVLFGRRFFEETGGFAPHFFVCEDYELWPRAMAMAPVGYIDEPLTIKRAGTWPQLSATRELDRYRVLALHRFYRKLRRDPALQKYEISLLDEALHKCRILHAGAVKYGQVKKAARYQAWLTLFRARRTRAMR